MTVKRFADVELEQLEVDGVKKIDFLSRLPSYDESEMSFNHCTRTKDVECEESSIENENTNISTANKILNPTVTNQNKPIQNSSMSFKNKLNRVMDCENVVDS